MDSRKELQKTLNHIQPDKIVTDFGATAITGIHCKVVAALRDHYGLEKRPVRISDTFQMLGMIEDDLCEAMGVDVLPAGGKYDVFGLDTSRTYEQTTPWGQKVIVPEGFDMTADSNGDVFIYPQGDRNVPASGTMPAGCFFVNAVERQEPIDESCLDPEDNLEEYGLLSDEDIAFIAGSVETQAMKGKGIIASFGGMGLGDVAFVPGMGLKHPKGIRSVVEWYMSTVMRQDYIHRVFEKQVDYAIENYSRIWEKVGDKIDAIVTCGTDFGTQESQFCSEETFRELWLPHYRRFNDWVHKHTTWKSFKHCCGSIFPLIPSFIDSGFDILNPVQINAKDMDSRRIKEEFGRDLVFWGGGVDTQKILPFGTPEQVRKQVAEQCEILGKDGGFVFNTVHNIQANVPVQNVVAMLETLKSLA